MTIKLLHYLLSQKRKKERNEQNDRKAFYTVFKEGPFITGGC